MPPKRQASVSSIAINTSSTNKYRSNAASDLITKSQAALSSQASVLQKTQNSQISQETNFNFGMPDNEDMQFNRQEMSEVQISKQEEQMIQKILEVARKGKINSKNAFEIPIKVVSSETSFSVNNKFWKFASELLSASMSIYDKRVQNMYLSTGAFENKLSRIGFEIKSRKQGEKVDQKHDDVHADEESKAKRNRQERHDILKISIEDFSGALNLDDESMIGFQTLDKKEKLDIKNVENKFIADPTFERTQKMFDSFSLRSLMLNIFQLSAELDVRIFMKSDLEWQKQRKEEKQRTQKNIELDKPQQNEEQQKQLKENGQINSQTQTNKSLAQIQALNQKSREQALPYYLLKHIDVSKGLMETNNFLEEIESFIVKQPELKEDYLSRKINSKKPNLMEVQEENSQSLENLTYGQIIQTERNQFYEIMKQFHESYDEDIGGHLFAQIQNGEGLYETENLSQSQFQNSQPLGFSQSFLNKSFAADNEANSMPSMPVSFQQNFYSWDQQNNIIEPIMPWEIQFKNLELTKKMKKGSKNQTKQGKKNSKKSLIPNIDFQLSILDRKQVLAQKDIKKKFESQKIVNTRMKECKTVSKEFDIVHSEYHTRFSNRFSNSRNTIISFQKKNANREQQPGGKSGQNFLLDFDQSMMEPSLVQKKGLGDESGNQDEQTRLLEAENYPQNNEQDTFLSGQKMTKNTSYVGIQMGVNNIREIKAMIVSEINEKGKTTLEFMNQMLVNLSPQQLFTIFLHLTNEYHYEIFNEDKDQTTIVLTKAVRGRNNRGQDRHRNGNVQDIEI